LDNFKRTDKKCTLRSLLFLAIEAKNQRAEVLYNSSDLLDRTITEISWMSFFKLVEADGETTNYHFSQVPRKHTR
jgi:hypothetical protein